MPNSNDLIEAVKYVSLALGLITAVYGLGVKGLNSWVDVSKEHSVGNEAIEKLKKKLDQAEIERAEINKRHEKLSDEMKDLKRSYEILRDTVSDNMQNTMNLILRGTKQ